MLYLLDTNICIYIAKRKPPEVLARLREMRPGDIGMSVVTQCELNYGAAKSRESSANLAKLEILSSLIPVQRFDSAAAEHYGRIRADLERAGQSIGPLDLLIAAHALSLDLTLVTNNEREFDRVTGLRVENWAQPQP